MLRLSPFGANGELEFVGCLIVDLRELAAPIAGNVWSRRRDLFLRGAGEGEERLPAARKSAEEGAVDVQTSEGSRNERPTRQGPRPSRAARGAHRLSPVGARRGTREPTYHHDDPE